MNKEGEKPQKPKSEPEIKEPKGAESDEEKRIDEELEKARKEREERKKKIISLIKDFMGLIDEKAETHEEVLPIILEASKESRKIDLTKFKSVFKVIDKLNQNNALKYHSDFFHGESI